MRKFTVTEEVKCPDCEPPKPCEVCGDPHGNGSILVEVDMVEALKEFMVDVPNTGYFGIIVPNFLADS